MAQEKYMLTIKDQQLIRKFQIKKQVSITLFKLKLNVLNKALQLPSYAIRSKKLTNTPIHSSAARNTKRFKCTLCTYSCATKSHLKQHSWTQSTDKRFKCANCPYQTNIKRDLERHFSTHAKHKNKPFAFQFCKRSFTAKANKNNSHEIVCIQNPKQDDATWVDSQKRFQCKFCNQKIIAKRELTQHIRTHTMEKPFECHICDYAASISGNLQQHVERKHNQNRLRNFPCKLCPQSFFTNEDLYSHIRTHTKEPYSDSACEFCKKQFLRKQDCNYHQIICKLNPKQCDEEWVRQQKKFKCQLCDYATTVRQNLKTHMMSHTGQRPFKCFFCQYGATTKENLHRHLMRHTKEKPHKCPHCHFTAGQNSQITYHVRRQHSQVKLG